MKKWILTAALAAVTLFANAQDNITSKNGTPILPEAGDWSIGFDASPWLSYAGNMFSGKGNSSPTANYLASNTSSAPMFTNTIVGKYMKNATTAYRGMLRIGFNRATKDSLLDDGAGNTVTNTTVGSTMNITVGGGMQWYRGKGRLKGYYGAMAMVMVGTNDTTYTFGKSTTSGIIEKKKGSTFGFGINGFIGAEYFFAPKMSIGAEYTWGLMMSSTGQGAVTTTDGAGNNTTVNTGGSSNFDLDVHNWGGAINLSLYF